MVEIDFNLANSEGVNIYSRRDGDADFKFLARDTSPTYVDNRPLLVANKPEIREYKAVFVVGDIEASPMTNQEKSYALGFLVLNYLGEQGLRELFDSTRKTYEGTAAAAAGPSRPRPAPGRPRRPA